MTQVHRRRVAQFDITGLQVQSAPEKDWIHEKTLYKKILSAQMNILTPIQETLIYSKSPTEKRGYWCDKKSCSFTRAELI